MVVNVAVKGLYKSGEANQATKSELKCQICSRKGHTVSDCYNRLNMTKFPPSHNRVLSPHRPTSSSGHSANLLTMWYPNSRATTHVTTSSQNVQRPRPFSGNDYIFTADGNPLPVSACGQTIVNSSTNKSFVLRDLLHVPTTSKNLLSVYRFCYDNNVELVFNDQIV